MNRKGTRHSPESLKEVIDASESWSDVLDYYNLSYGGSSRSYLKKLAIKWEIDSSHLSRRKRKYSPGNRKSSEEILQKQDRYSKPTIPYQLRRALLDIGIEHKCSICGLGPVWQGRKLVLQIDHIDGRKWNNNKENLRFLCPNCHSQTSNWGVYNRR